MNQSSFNNGTGSTGPQRGWRPGDLISNAAKAAQLMFNPNVPLWMKTLIPMGTLLYWVWPIDLIPGVVLDDIGVLLLALTIFTRMAEQAVNKAGTAGPAPVRDDVVDTTWRVIDEDR